MDDETPEEEVAVEDPSAEEVEGIDEGEELHPDLEWMYGLQTEFMLGTAHVFVLTGNIHDKDYAQMGELTRTLSHSLARVKVEGRPRKRRTMVSYDLSSGVQFPFGDDDQKIFDLMVNNGVVKEEESGSSNAMMDLFKRNMPGGNGGNGYSLQDIDKALRFDPANFLQPTPPELNADPDASASADPPEHSDDDPVYTAEDFRLCVLITGAEFLCPDGEISQMSSGDRLNQRMIERWTQSSSIGNNFHLILMTANSALSINKRIVTPSSLAQAIEIPLPCAESRREHIENFLSTSHEMSPIGESATMDMTIEEAVNISEGLTKKHIEDVILSCMELGLPVSSDNFFQHRKKIMNLEYYGAVDVFKPTFGFDETPGHEDAKNFFSKVIIPGLKRGDRSTPSAVLFVGPPGHGKTFIGLALAKESGLPVISVNLGRLKSKYVGESEEMIDNVFRLIRHFGGCIVILDEMDQQVSSRESGNFSSSVDGHFLGFLLQYLSDPSLKGKVCFVGMSNRPDQLDPALIRDGRFDKKIPFLPANATDRAKIIASSFKHKGLRVDDELIDQLHAYAEDGVSQVDELNALIESTDKWSHASLGSLVQKAFEASMADEREVVLGDLVRAETLIIPTPMNEEMLMRSIGSLNDLEFVPEEWRESFMERKRLSSAKDTKRRAQKTSSVSVEPSPTANRKSASWGGRRTV